MILALLLGCARHREGEAADPLAVMLAEGDAAFADRGRDPAKIAVAEERWLAATTVDPTDPRPYARLSHASWVRAYTTPEEARGELETGVEYGWRCLRTWPSFASQADLSGFRVSDDAVATLGLDAVPCMAWLGNNGLDRVASRGPGGELALEGLAKVVRRAATLAPRGEGGMVARAEGLLLVLTDGDRAAARAAFERAIDTNPTFLPFRVDLAVAFPDAPLTLPEPPQPDPFALEDASARARAAAMATPGPG